MHESDGGATIGRQVLGGMASLGLASAVTRGTALSLHFGLAYVLRPHEFGLYALVVGSFALIQASRDGGIRHLLAQRGSEQSRRLAATAFRSAFAYNAAFAALLVAAGPVAARVYDDENIAEAFYVLAALPPVGTLGSIAQARLRSLMRFTALGWIEVIASLLKVTATLVLAIMWAGSTRVVHAFTIPMVLYVAVGSVMSVLALREPILRARTRIGAWRRLARPCSWLVVQNVAATLASAGVYPILALVMSREDLGTYFFALQLVGQLSTVYSMTAEVVMLPALVAVRQARETYDQLLTQVLHNSLAWLQPLGLLVALAFPALELMVWNGKWAHAAWVVYALALAQPFAVLSVLAKTALMERGDFRTAAFWLSGISIGHVTGAVAGAWFLGGTFAVAASASGAASGLGLIALCHAARPRVVVRTVGVAILKWLPATVIASVLLAAFRDETVVAQLGAFSATIVAVLVTLRLQHRHGWAMATVFAYRWMAKRRSPADGAGV